MVYKDNRSVYFYDSFARNVKKILPSIFSVYNRVIESDRSDKEQRDEEENCGARSMAFLYIVDKYGIDKALLI